MSPKRKHYYKKAATKYWENRGELDNVDCRPNEVYITGNHYGTKISDGAARTIFWGAYTHEHKDYYGEYCTVFFNLDQPRNKPSSCIIFMHEYGHMLGKDDEYYPSTNIQSVMYQGYVHKGGGGYNADLQNRWKSIILAKTLC